MKNNISKNQQLLKDRLFLEKVFLLDIESDRKTNTTDLIPILEPQSKQSDRSNDVRLSDVDLVSTPVPQRTITPISLVSIYAVVVTLLLLLPSNREGANGKTILKDIEPENERISLLETKIQQLEAKTQILALQATADSEHKSLPVVETARPVSLPIQSEQAPPCDDGACSDRWSTATGLEAINLEPERGVDNSTQRTTDTDRLPPLPETASSPVVIQTPIQSSIADTLDTAIIPIDRLSPLPVPTPPPLTTQISSPLPLPPTFAKTEIAVDTVNLNSSTKPMLEIKSEVIVPETTVEEKIDESAEQWLGQTDAVYYSFSFQENSTSENLAEAEASLPDDEDLKQYLTAVKSRSKVQAVEQPTSSLLSTEQPIVSDRSLDSDSQPAAELKQLLVDGQDQKSLAESKLVTAEGFEQYSDSSFLRSDRSNLSSTVSDSEELGQPKLFEDEDLARYLDSAPLLDDEYIRQILGTSPSTELKTQSETDKKEAVTFEVADKNSELNAPKIVRQSSTDSDLVEPKTERPLFADEDLRQFLTHTALFDDSTLKQKLK